jgi:hypothetical protein
MSATSSLRADPAWIAYRHADGLARYRAASAIAPDFTRYRSDPSPFAAFVERELSETLTPELRALLDSVWRYPVTLVPSANQTGKTFSVARLAVAFYKITRGAVYTTAAPPESNLRNLLWGEIGAVVEKHPELFAEDRVTDLRIGRSAQSFITGVTIPQSGTPAQRKARFSGKHPPNGLLFVVDEGDAVPGEIYEAIESCMSGGFCRLVITYNPRHESGPVYLKEKAGAGNVVRLSALTHPNVVEGREAIPHAVDRETTVRRINEWTRALAPNEPRPSDAFAVPAFLVGAVAHSHAGVAYPPLPPGERRITEGAFSTMVLGEYPAEGERQLISRTSTAAAVSRWHAYVARFGEVPPEAVAPVMGLDVADEGKDLSVAAYRYGGWVPRLTDLRAGVDADAVADWAAGLYVRRGCRGAMVDGTGVGAGVAPKMTRAGCKDVAKVMVASAPTEKTELGEFALLRDQLLWALREWLKSDPGAMLPPDADLLDELHALSYDTDGAGGKLRVTQTKVLRELLGRSPDRLMALALTFATKPKRKLIDL